MTSDVVTASKEPILIIDDDKSICKTLKLHFERAGYDVITTFGAKEGLEQLSFVKSAIVILDVRLPDANGIELLKEIREERGDDLYSIIVTAFPDMDSTIKAVQSGVGEYIHKPIDIDEINGAVEKANDFFQSKTKSKPSCIPVPTLAEIGTRFVGKSPVMKEVFKTVGMVSMSRATAHVTGESGTGKELVAHAIHQNSSQKNEPFISVNCSAIVSTLLESELFGHDKGSFTGAIAQKDGKFSMARGGAIFLDEIGEMDINLQAKLLRVLQEREFYRVGGKEKLKCNCRIISATNKEMKELVKIGKFREDLYYRLNVINIHIPPLRERRDDIRDLALFFIAKTNLEANKRINEITKGSIEFLQGLPWRGNVRQLENVITQAVIMNNGERLTREHFSMIIKPEDLNVETDLASGPSFGQAKPNGYRPRSLNDIEQEQIGLALSHTKWHKGKACEILGITRPRLERKIRKYKIAPAQL